MEEYLSLAPIFQFYNFFINYWENLDLFPNAPKKIYIYITAVSSVAPVRSLLWIIDKVQNVFQRLSLLPAKFNESRIRSTIQR